ncbi:MAG: DHH family phosphoesterase [Candidatus Dormibacteraceae bacterium]
MTAAAAIVQRPWPAALREGLQELRLLLDEQRDVVIFGHKDADGDTLGCSLAFAEGLRRQGHRAWVVIPPPHPALYEWVPGFADLLEQPPDGVEGGVALFLDASNVERAVKQAAHLVDRAAVVNIDHHESNTRFGTLNLVDPEAAAVGQMCLQLFDELGWPITPTMATCLYAAILTDTGGFRHGNTNASVLGDAARLCALGADPADIAGRIYSSRPLSTMRLQSHSLASMQVEAEGRIAWARVTKQMLHQTGSVMAESEGIIDSLNSISGLWVAIVFKEVSASLVKISVRTRHDVDAAAICAEFGGGGHRRAAGAELPGPMREAIDAVLGAATQAIEHASGRSQYR